MRAQTITQILQMRIDYWSKGIETAKQYQIQDQATPSTKEQKAENKKILARYIRREREASQALREWKKIRNHKTFDLIYLVIQGGSDDE